MKDCIKEHDLENITEFAIQLMKERDDLRRRVAVLAAFLGDMRFISNQDICGEKQYENEFLHIRQSISQTEKKLRKAK